ncbi:hypothetical protein LTR56_011525 [Elasticomyces elasticus]|nr:hypothetical protein LTR56_011525 [Elasticomyces elasticus]KAK3643254.1 hypothetical protein LTR22_015721 [Elasticomyces elasticus]
MWRIDLFKWTVTNEMYEMKRSQLLAEGKYESILVRVHQAEKPKGPDDGYAPKPPASRKKTIATLRNRQIHFNFTPTAGGPVETHSPRLIKIMTHAARKYDAKEEIASIDDVEIEKV